MKTSYIFFSFICLSLASFLFASCTLLATEDASDSLASIPDETSPVLYESVLIDVEQLSPSETGSYDFTERSLVIATDEASFSELWEKLHSSQIPTPDRPHVNFEESIVAGAMMGVQPSGGYSIEVMEAAVDPDYLWIRTDEKEPGQDCAVTDVITSPYHLVKIPRAPAENKVPRLVFNRIAEDCDS
jgi:hypothetical protein